MSEFWAWGHQFAQKIVAMLSEPEKIAGALVALAAVGKWLLEYTKANRLKRFEKFQEMRKRTDEEPLSEALDLIEKGNESITTDQIETVMAFYEEVALMLNSNFINTRIAYYMFGYYCVEAYRSSQFKAVYEADEFWFLFRKFGKKMSDFDNRFSEVESPHPLLRAIVRGETMRGGLIGARHWLTGRMRF